MKKVPLYSRSRRIAEPEPSTATAASGATASAAVAAPVAVAPATRLGRWKAGALRNERRLWALAVVALLVGAVLLNPRLASHEPALTFEQIDAAMRQSIEEKPLASAATRAYEAVLPSVVRVLGLMTEGDDGDDDKAHGTVERGVGTGVVIIDNGTILTNLQVVSGAKADQGDVRRRHRVGRSVLASNRERPPVPARQTIPTTCRPRRCDRPATSRPAIKSLAGGFPFGIGPSVSAGVGPAETQFNRRMASRC